MNYLETEIANWDGKSATDIRAIHQKHHAEVGYVTQLVLLLEKKGLQSGVTWLLKAAFEASVVFTPKDVAIIYKHSPLLDTWEPKLHILQCMAYMPIEEPQQAGVEEFLRACLADDNKFVRAWAYNGFYYFAKQFETYREEAGHLFEIALKDEAPSVKARVRKVAGKKF